MNKKSTPSNKKGGVTCAEICAICSEVELNEEGFCPSDPSVKVWANDIDLTDRN